LIDMGPEGGHKGGQVLAVGTPEELADIEESHTGQFLRRVLELDGPLPPVTSSSGKAARARAVETTKNPAPIPAVTPRTATKSSKAAPSKAALSRSVPSKAAPARSVPAKAAPAKAAATKAATSANGAAAEKAPARKAAAKKATASRR
jgi:excinuclease ABC subunit A